jgi:hypothetical protein
LVSDRQSRDQLHRWWLPSSQEQYTTSIKRKGDRPSQH